ncbi:hypothetical protein NITLEN_11056 [Nitrospira lenta]|uniref:Uncharacterized protein n=1 Tax=Nitrospira lenta TaxID=1436998 RepID=A0A330L2K2_9BACT|nr:hypothetical protein NITLEN_11056 [Nitrospira lenta]
MHERKGHMIAQKFERLFSWALSCNERQANQKHVESTQSFTDTSQLIRGQGEAILAHYYWS